MWNESMVVVPLCLLILGCWCHVFPCHLQRVWFGNWTQWSQGSWAVSRCSVSWPGQCATQLGCLLWARPWRYSVSYVPCVECPMDSLSVLLHLAAFFEHGLGGTVCRMSHALSVPWTLCLFYYTWLPSLSTALEIQCVVCPMRWVSHPVLCLFH